MTKDMRGSGSGSDSHSNTFAGMSNIRGSVTIKEHTWVAGGNVSWSANVNVVSLGSEAQAQIDFHVSNITVIFNGENSESTTPSGGRIVISSSHSIIPTFNVMQYYGVNCINIRAVCHSVRFYLVRTEYDENGSIVSSEYLVDDTQDVVIEFGVTYNFDSGTLVSL